MDVCQKVPRYYGSIFFKKLKLGMQHKIPKHEAIKPFGWEYMAPPITCLIPLDFQ
jgi:hypothetical protein